MKAAVFHGPKQPLRIEEVPNPQPGPDDIIVKVAACGVCHTDLHYIDHGVPTAKKPPLILGHECSGTVAQCGPNVKNFKPGDRVLLPAVLTCGVCDFCRLGRENICKTMTMFGNHIDGAYAEFVRAPAKDTFILPQEIPLEEGSIIADAISTPYHAVKNRANVRPGDTLAVVGCGGVGLNLVQMAVAAGASVIAVDLVDAKLDIAKKLGAIAVVNPSKTADAAKDIKKLTGGGADIAVEVVGSPKTIELAFGMVRKGGRVCIVGFCDKDVPLPVSKIMFFEIDVVGSLGCRPVDYPRLIEMVRIGKVKVKEMVSGRFPLDKINDAFDMLRRGEGLRWLICP
ncbi:MAG: zinc-binding dehydrogenase [Planctomycetota bacterium]|nr:zinc-binding dehydrogenase [Planctomycetota bacterium]